MWERLTKWLNASKSKLTKETFFKIYESRGEVPPIDKIPIDLEDLPSVVHNAVEVFNSLGDRLIPDIGYIGKDYTALSQILNMRGIESSELLLDIILWLDNHCIKESVEKSKKDKPREN